VKTTGAAARLADHLTEARRRAGPCVPVCLALVRLLAPVPLWDVLRQAVPEIELDPEPIRK
jgi:hypothetical protein